MSIRVIKGHVVANGNPMAILLEEIAAVVWVLNEPSNDTCILHYRNSKQWLHVRPSTDDEVEYTHRVWKANKTFGPPSSLDVLLDRFPRLPPLEPKAERTPERTPESKL